jgi:protein Tex
VHVSQLADRYIRDANEVVKVGQKVKVTVQSVDLPRNRIALSMKSDGGLGGSKPQDPGSRGARGPAPKGAPAKPAHKPFVPTKGAVAPNGIRFK